MIETRRLQVLDCGAVFDFWQHQVWGSAWIAPGSVNAQDGTATSWVFALGPATSLAQRRVGPHGANALHQGDKITVKFIPARNGSPLGFLEVGDAPVGRVINISAGNPTIKR